MAVERRNRAEEGHEMLEKRRERAEDRVEKDS
jgi:hypothetical protein